MKRMMLVTGILLAVGCGVESKSSFPDSSEEIERHDEYYEYDCLNNCDEQWFEQTPQTPIAPVPAGDVVACKPAPACAHECVIDVASGESNCDLDMSSGRAVVDMSQSERLTVRATLRNPEGFSFHIGDSPTNNGHGGDDATHSNDAELHLVGTKLLVYGSDYSVNDPGHVREFPEQLSPSGGVLDVTLEDGRLSVRMDDDPLAPMCFVQESYDLLRLDAADHEGAPDRLWYMGLNQVQSGGRTGSGLELVELCFH